MAVGDDALAAGIELTPGTAPASDIDLWINKLADEVARRTMTTQSVARGGTGATNAAAARQNLGVTSENIPDNGQTVRTNIQFLADQLADTFRKGETYSRGVIDGAFSSRDTNINYIDGRATAALDGNLTSASYNRALGGTRRTAWLQDNGQLGYAASSERYKKYVRPEDVTDEQVLQLALVSYQWKAAVAVDDRREMGLIAERVVEAGLGWAAFYNQDGTVEGLNYEMVALAMLPAVQRLIARTHRIEDRLEALEAPQSTAKDPS